MPLSLGTPGPPRSQLQTSPLLRASAAARGCCRGLFSALPWQRDPSTRPPPRCPDSSLLFLQTSSNVLINRVWVWCCPGAPAQLCSGDCGDLGSAVLTPATPAPQPAAPGHRWGDASPRGKAEAVRWGSPPDRSCRAGLCGGHCGQGDPRAVPWAAAGSCCSCTPEPGSPGARRIAAGKRTGKERRVGSSGCGELEQGELFYRGSLSFSWRLGSGRWGAFGEAWIHEPIPALQ